jgi:hypothetical protein
MVKVLASRLFGLLSYTKDIRDAALQKDQNRGE